MVVASRMEDARGLGTQQGPKARGSASGLVPRAELMSCRRRAGI
jgi:hypothetical protein